VVASETFSSYQFDFYLFNFAISLQYQVCRCSVLYITPVSHLFSIMPMLHLVQPVQETHPYMVHLTMPCDRAEIRPPMKMSIALLVSEG